MTKPVKSRRRRSSVEQLDVVPHVVPTPKWLQRKMLRNLSRTAHSNINLQLAKRSGQLLAVVEAESKPAAKPVSNDNSTAKAPIPPIAPAAVPVTGVSRIRRLATATLGQYIRRVSTFVKRNLFLRPAHAG
jgi:hypothetical protein